MKNRFSFIILAVTKTYDKFCIAGMDEKGKWVRPLPVGTEKFWSYATYDNGKFIKVGDVWEITEYQKEFDDNSPGHTEDLRLLQHPTLTKRLSNNQLIQFLGKYKEDREAFTHTINGDGRSLCLVEADKFRNYLYTNPYKGSVQPRITFSNKGVSFNNITSTPGFPITDLKWRAYTFQKIVTRGNWNSIFICVGLARTEPKKGFNREYPMVISIITDPSVPLLPTYPL